jgi:hypothetical protein
MATRDLTPDELRGWQDNLERREDELVTREAELQDREEALQRELVALDRREEEFDARCERHCVDSDSETDEVADEWRAIARRVVEKRRAKRVARRAAAALQAQHAEEKGDEEDEAAELILRRTKRRTDGTFVPASALLGTTGADPEATVDLANPELGEIEGERIATQESYESAGEGQEAKIFL